MDGAGGIHAKQNITWLDSPAPCAPREPDCCTRLGPERADILEKMIGADGGRRLLEAIKDSTMVREMALPTMGLSASVTIYHEEPNKFRQDQEAKGSW